MNTPSKEALEAAKQSVRELITTNGWPHVERDMATIIDRHFAPLRKRLAEMESLLESEKATRNSIIAKGQQAEARVKELTDECAKYLAAQCRLGDRVKELEAELGRVRTKLHPMLRECQIERAALRAANAELQKQEAESRRLFHTEQDKQQSAEFRREELAGALRKIRDDGMDAAQCRALARATLARHAAGEPEAQK